MANKKKQDYPVRIKMKPPVPARRKSDSLPADSLMEGAVDRANREQAREADSLRRMNMKKKPMDKYAKGGNVKGSAMKADGIAKKGKTHTKMVKMAGGGSCGTKKMAKGGMPMAMKKAMMKKKGMKKGY